MVAFGFEVNRDRDLGIIVPSALELIEGVDTPDPMTAVAFNPKIGLRLKPILGSDISHFDVVDASEVLGEAWELVEHGLIDEQDFREFTFSNVVQLCAGMNPDFFQGTVVEKSARRELALAEAKEIA